MRLLTVDCKEQAQKALKYEGQVVFQSSFKVLGEVAMQELLSNPAVSAGAAGFEKHLDKKKLQSILSNK